MAWTVAEMLSAGGLSHGVWLAERGIYGQRAKERLAETFPGARRASIDALWSRVLQARKLARELQHHPDRYQTVAKAAPAGVGGAANYIYEVEIVFTGRDGIVHTFTPVFFSNRPLTLSELNAAAALRAEQYLRESPGQGRAPGLDYIDESATVRLISISRR